SSVADIRSVEGSRPISSHTRRTFAKRSAQPLPAPLLNSSACRAAIRGVRRGPGARLLDEHGKVAGLLELPEPAVEAERFALRRRPQPCDDPHRLVEPVEALADRRERDAE